MDEHKISDIFEVSSREGIWRPEEFVAGYCGRFASLLSELNRSEVSQTIKAIEAVRQRDQTIFLIGNGGSASVCSHFANDLSPKSLIVGPGTEGFQGGKVLALADNLPLLTAIANDSGYEDVFAVCLEAQMEPRDLVIAMSVSGNSPNIIKAVEYANSHGGETIGWTGFDGGRLREICFCIHTPSTKDEYGPVEDMFSILVHLISNYLHLKCGGKLYH